VQTRETKRKETLTDKTAEREGEGEGEREKERLID